MVMFLSGNQIGWGRFFFTSSISQDTTKSSRTLDRHDVSDIGLVSAIGLLVLGIGTMFDFFQLLGTTPEARDVLKIMVIGSAMPPVYASKWVFLFAICLNLFRTFAFCIEIS